MNVLPMLMIVLLSLNVLMRSTATPVFAWTVSLTPLLLTDFYLVESAAMVGLCFYKYGNEKNLYNLNDFLA